ncbi:MAG: hypothetical protein H0W06_05765 [Chloroflexia bacterium]|nr:hypothetical protein [Chloroflexia bacterium]
MATDQTSEQPSSGTDPTAGRASSQSDDMKDFVLQAAGTQLAAMSAFVRFWAGWAESANTYTQGLGEELARVRAGTEDDTAGRVADLTRAYVRSVVDLPVAAARQFVAEVERTEEASGGKTRKGPRTRSARVKV